MLKGLLLYEALPGQLALLQHPASLVMAVHLREKPHCAHLNR